ncbi:MAG: phenylalanine--tRNA ligase subunit beta, partial [Clostridia bacterium]|nr:phenylalanine--tRNA ligase subunit beta [Clostridia bacterium]
ANFNGPSVRLTAKAVGLRTEASGRYEKGLDRENTLPAIERACELIELLGAGKVVKGIIDVYAGKAPQNEIKFDAKRINDFLGTDVPEESMIDTFKRLDIELKDGILYPPSYRADLEGIHDIAEEVIRIYGYDKIPTTNFKSEAIVGGRNARQKSMVSLNNLMTQHGFYEVQTFSFISPKYYDNIGLAEDAPERDSVVISNPLGEDTSIMRTTALPSVLEVLSTNRRYRNKSCAIYENAKVYIKRADNDQPDERMSKFIAFYDGGDFYTMKGVAEQVLANFGIEKTEAVAKKDLPYFHPGRCAELTDADGKAYCVFGELHPDTAKVYGFDLPVYACICDTESLLAYEAEEKKYKPLPKFPAIERDLAFVCDEALTSGELKKSIQKYGGKMLESVEIFDIYRDAKLGENKKSMAYSITLRSPEKTLEDTDCDKIVYKILNGLERDFGVTLRS